MNSVYLTNPVTGAKRGIKKAYNISYSERSNNLFTGGFTLSADDDLTKKIKQFSFIEIYDGEKRVELFVVVKSAESYGSSVPVIKYDLMDALFLLNLSVIEFLQLTNPTTREAMQAVMDCQYLPYWTLGDVEFSRGFSYQWENENGLLSPLMSVLDDTAEQYVIERDTTKFPFVLHFRKPTSKVSARVKQGYNMTGFTVEQEGKNLVNWILPKGNAEGINTVDISKLNGGKRYLMDQSSMDEFFPAMTIWKDDRYTVADNLFAAAKSRLNAWKEPNVDWNVSAVDLTKVLRHPENLAINQNRKIKANELKLDSLVEVETKKYGKINLRVLERSKSDVTGKPGEMTLKITNEGINAFAYDEERQQDIARMTANGAQNIIPYIFDREADDTEPVDFSFEIPEDCVNVNNAFLWIKPTNFRATSKGNKSTDTVVSSNTSSAGGGTTVGSTSESGGGTTVGSTSSAGGGQTVGTTSSSGGGQTSSANGNHRHVMFTAAAGPLNWTEGVFAANGTAGLMLKTNTSGSIETAGSSGTHSHTVSSHTHTVSITINAHTHDVSINIPAHTHKFSVKIEPHTHQVSITIPGHTHPIIYGIFKYSRLPSSMEVWIDDNVVPVDSTSVSRLDVVKYLKKDSSGKVVRGAHKLKIKPNDLVRFEIQLMLTVFIKSRIGGKV
ncbi:phage tail spike protein [Enterococcus asini]|uniref:phage tail spike protein n=1 Tax=Enterococcus asini TaxID=57732 RepID=UPI0022E870DA|nr:phage tail spike protein [Enterococcus asini]